MRPLYASYTDPSIWLQLVAKLDDKEPRTEFLRQAFAEIGDATVNPLIVGIVRDRSLNKQSTGNRFVQDYYDKIIAP